MKRALLVGGTAASGVAIAEELRRRDFEITIYHRGTHELPRLDDLEHIHGDPHFAASIAADLGSREWDVTVATYGRTRLLAEQLRGRTGQFVMVGGTPAAKELAGIPTLDERGPYASAEDAATGIVGLLPRIIETELAVLELGEAGEFAATVVRYPYVYGPHSVVPMEWHVIKRVLDGRRRWATRGAGLQLSGRCASVNAARLIGLAIDQPVAAAGEVFHAADERQYSLREWVEIVAAAAGGDFEFVDLPTAAIPFGTSAVPMDGEFTWVSARDVAARKLSHATLSSEKARRVLGYRDAVPAPEWIARTVEFWLAHPPAVDGLGGRLAPEEFDYAAEDALLSWLDRSLAAVPAIGRPLARGHVYEHPKEPAR